MINRVKLAAERGWDVCEIYKACDAWRKLYVRQPSSTITFFEYLDLMQQSGLRPNMVGLKKGQHHLARYNDSGAYSIGNCRFVPQEQNQQERKEGYQRDPGFRKVMKDIALRRVKVTCHHCGKSATAGMFARWHGVNCKMASSL